MTAADDADPLALPGLLLDVPAKNITAAVQFIRDVLGWKVDENASYPEFGDGTFTGFLFEGDGSEAWPLVVVRVRDLDEALRRLDAHGGGVVTRRTQEGGISAIVHDPSGNRWGLWQAT